MHPAEGGIDTPTTSTSSSVDPIQDAERALLDDRNSSSRLWRTCWGAGVVIATFAGYLLVQSVSFHSSTAQQDLDTAISKIVPVAAAIGFAWRSRPPGSAT